MNMKDNSNQSDEEGSIGLPEFDQVESDNNAGSTNTTHPETAIQSGEEKEDLIFFIRAKLYRWRNDEWKERGIGVVKFLRHKETYQIRMILRNDKTKKAAANFLISSDPLCCLKNHLGSERMFFFTAYDFSEYSIDNPNFPSPKIEKYVIKLTNGVEAEDFKINFEKAKKFNINLKNGGVLEFADIVELIETEEVEEIDPIDEEDQSEVIPPNIVDE